MADGVDRLKGSRFVVRKSTDKGLTDWWICKSGICLRYADEISPVKLEESFKQGSEADDEFALLDKLLRDATGLWLKCAAEDPWRQRVVEVLRTPGSVPMLRTLWIGWSKEDVEESGLSESLVETSAAVITSILDCIKSRNLSHLTEIVLHVDGLDRSGADKLHTRALADIISADLLPSLTSFSLSVGRLEDESLTALARAFADGHLKQLTHFWLRIWSAGEHAVSPLAAVFEEGAVPALRQSFVYDSAIGDAGAEALARAFACGRLKTLTVLYLDNNSIGDRGMISLAESFEAGGLPDLTMLDVEGNPFGTEGAIALSRAFGSGQLGAMKILWARRTRMGEDGARALVDALSNNPLLVVNLELDWESYPRALKQRNDRLLKRNQKNLEILPALRESMVPATLAKVYLCGNPEVGKTTLRKSLQRSLWESMSTSEKRHNEEKRTKGIDVSGLMVKGDKQQEQALSLMIWDMAGQDEYHLLHNSILVDMSSFERSATTFVVLCTSKTQNSVQQLEYWLRFIASSSGQSAHNARSVLVVINRIDGDKDVLNDAKEWNFILEEQRKKFEGHLDIRTDPFIVDVRKRKHILDLKETLVKHSREVLKTYQVPKICEDIQANLGLWSKEREQFPVIRWTEFVEKVQAASPRWPGKTIEAAAKYLNEAGALIYVTKDFLAKRGTTSEKLVVLNPNWFCKEVVGNMLLPHQIARSGKSPFRLQVDQNSGSIPIDKLAHYFRLSIGQNDDQVEDFLRILLWLGLCYKGHEQSYIFIPALIEIDKSCEAFPIQDESSDLKEDQWVMGYTIEHLPSETSLASLALWHRFQVKLAQSAQFNGHPDSDYVVGRFFITFKSDFMRVVIRVNATKDHPTFDGIYILVKPFLSSNDDFLESSNRQMCQVDLADNIAVTLLQFWEEACPGVACVQKVVWPWPASQSRPSSEIMTKRSVEVVEVKGWIRKHGLGRALQWKVGSNIITEDQLLSTKDKEGMINSTTMSVDFMKTSMREAVELGMFPEDILNEEEFSDSLTLRSEGQEYQDCTPSVSTASDLVKSLNSPAVEKILKRLDKLLYNSEEILRVTHANLKVSIAARDDLRKLLRTQKNVAQKVHSVLEMFLQDKEASFPKFCYLGKQDSSAWTTLKDALSAHAFMRIRLYFACEANYDDNRPHKVTLQPGIDVSVLKDWGRNLAPWLNVALTVLFVSAKAAATFAAPGTGFLFPDAPWQQASSLSEGIALLTGFSQEQLNKFMREGDDVDEISSKEAPKELYAKSKRVVNKILSDLSTQEFEEKLKLTKMALLDRSGNFERILWVCDHCQERYKEAKLGRDLST